VDYKRPQKPLQRDLRARGFLCASIQSNARLWAAQRPRVLAEVTSAPFGFRSLMVCEAGNVTCQRYTRQPTKAQYCGILNWASGAFGSGDFLQGTREKWHPKKGQGRTYELQGNSVLRVSVCYVGCDLRLNGVALTKPKI